MLGLKIADSSNDNIIENSPLPLPRYIHEVQISPQSRVFPQDVGLVLQLVDRSPLPFKSQL